MDIEKEQSSLLEFAFKKLKEENFKLRDEIESNSYDVIKKNEDLIILQSTALEAAADGILITDVSGNITWSNKAFTNITGYSKEEVYQKKSNILKSGLQSKEFYSDLWQTISSGKTWIGELTNKKKNGKLYIDEMTITPVKNNDGVITNYIAIKHNITNRKILYDITAIAATCKSIDELYEKIHTSIKSIIDAENIYIALYDDKSRILSFPYFVDKNDDTPKPRLLNKGLTDYVIKNQKSLLLTPQVLDELLETKEVELIGAKPNSWLGVPLIFESVPLGAIVVQNYDSNVIYNYKDQEILESIANQIASAINRKTIENKLSEESYLFQQFMDNIPDSIYFKDINHSYIRINKNSATKLNIKNQSDIIGKTDFDLFTKDEAVASLIENQKIMETRETVKHEKLKKYKDGSSSWIESNKIPMVNEKNNVIGILGVARDISKRISYENELKDSHYKFKQLINNSTLGIIRLDNSGELIMANPAMVLMLGYESEADIISLNNNKLYKSIKSKNRFLSILNSEGKIYAYEDIFIKKDGSYIDVKESAWTIEDKERHVLYYEIIVEDITEQNQIYRILHESEFKYRMLIDKLSEAVYLLVDRKIELANSKFLELFEIEEEDIAQPEFDIFNYLSEESKKQFLEAEKKIIFHKDAPSIFQISIVTESGIEKEVEISISYLNYGGKKATQGVIRDLTELKKTETQIRHLQKMEAIGTLAAGIAHEINTPSQFINDNLTFLQDMTKEFEPIFNFLGNIKKDIATLEEIKTIVKNIDVDYIKEEIPLAVKQSLEGIERISNIVGAMRDFSHAGPKEKVSADMHKLINNSIIISSNTWKYIAKIDTNFDKSLPPIVCQASDLGQVFVNIIVNASHALEVKYAESTAIEGKILITTKNNEHNIDILINDNGSGMPEKVKKRIFDPFFTTKDVGKGTGQGLAIAYDIIVDKHNGNIEVESKENEGTTFIISLPKEI